MATPVGFEGANVLYRGDGREIGDLESFVENGTVTSCWRLSDDELEEVNRTGVVWVRVMMEPTPPIVVSGNALVLYEGRPSKAEPVLSRVKK